jgi:hypothetical protein
MIGNGLHFDADGEYLNIQDSPSLGGMPQMTMEVWVKFDELPSDSGQSQIIALKNGAYWLFLTGDNKLYFAVTNQDGATAWPGTDSAITLAGVWYHIVGVYDGSEAKIYVNGVQSGWTGSLMGNVGSSSDALIISKEPWTT